LVVTALERPGSGAAAATRASLAAVDPRLERAIAGLSAPPRGDKPVTLGIGEPFVTTMGIALIFALVLALPVVLFDLYGFLLPAFSPNQQRAATPLMLAIPLLFVLGVAFGYFVVLPAAVASSSTSTARSSTCSCRRTSTTASPPSPCWRWDSFFRSR